MPSTQGHTDRQFTFILVSDENDISSQKTVRAHAMRESIRQRKAGIQSSKPADPAPIPYSTGRFRLSSSSTKAMPSSRSKLKPSEPTGVAKSRWEAQDNCGGSIQFLDSPRPERAVSNSFPPVPSAGWLEPFDVMPVKLGLKQQKLLYYYRTTYIQNAWAFNSKTRMVSPASQDPAWLHAMFAVVALNHDLCIGNYKFSSAEALYHRGEALHFVQKRLEASSMNVSETTMGAVAALANHETLNGSFVGAATHLNGLEQMLRARGGIYNLSKNAFLLRKLLTLADLAFAQTWGRAPRLPFLEELGSAETAENEIGLSQDHSGGILAEPYICTSLRKVRILSEIMDDKDVPEVQREYFSRTLYQLHYRLTTKAWGLDAEEAPDDSESFKANSKRMAILIYMNIALREVPFNAGMNYIASKNLKASFERGGLPVITDSNKQLVLWMLFVGGAAAYGRFERSYYVNILSWMTTVMGISCLEEFRAALKSIAWTHAFCDPQSASLWKDMTAWNRELELSENDRTYLLPGRIPANSETLTSSSCSRSCSSDLPEYSQALPG